MRIALATIAVLLFLRAGCAETLTELTAAPAAAVQQPAPDAKPVVQPAAAADVVAPGIEVEVARKTLQRHGYELKMVPLALSSGSENIALDTIPIDDNITLILAFAKRTKKVTSLSLHFQPPYPTSTAQSFGREVLAMSFDKDGAYSVKLKRYVRKSDAAK